MTDYVIRPFRTMEECHECVALQEDTWGHGFSERVAPAILKVGQILGGVSSGAYDGDGRLVGFVFGLTGLRDGEVVHWSDMLAVRPEIRDAGLGRRLKAYQRDEVMALGIEKMFWTFDPLQSRNAHLNLTRLGAVIREYRIDMYGQTDSPLHRGIGTDRFVPLWQLPTDRVAGRVVNDPSHAFDLASIDPNAIGVVLDASIRSDALPVPGRVDLGLEHEWLSVAIPSDVGSLMERDLGLAQAWRAATRNALTHYLQSGYEVREFARGHRTSKYLLTYIDEAA
jgi:predicted GNAT superfamily acetyltransferase